MAKLHPRRALILAWLCMSVFLLVDAAIVRNCPAKRSTNEEGEDNPWKNDLKEYEETTANTSPLPQLLPRALSTTCSGGAPTCITGTPNIYEQTPPNFLGNYLWL